MIPAGLVVKIDNVLLPSGFERQEFVWNRQREGFVDVVDIQMSPSTDMFTINLGVCDPHVYRTVWNTDALEFVAEPNCTIRSRLGKLVDGKDRWWTSSDPNAVEQVCALLMSHGVPFVERVTSRSILEELLVEHGVAKRRYPPPIISLAILKIINGRRSDGLQLLQDLMSKTSRPWQERITAILERVAT